MRAPLRVAICPDFREEQWPSMDRVAGELLRALAEDEHRGVQAESILPLYRRRASMMSGGRLAVHIDRGLNRLFDYPSHVAAAQRSFDVFHVIDHSYAQLVHRLPAERTIVTCHDLDTFRSILAPADEPRSPLFQAMVRHILRGLSAAAIVTCDSEAVRHELVRAQLVDAERVLVVPIGVNRAFSDRPHAAADLAADRLLEPTGHARQPIDILHVGSTVPRKRIDVLLETLAAVRRVVPAVRLIRVGGALTVEQMAQAAALGLSDAVVSMPAVDDETLAAVYRRAALVLLPSEREGFGLPVAEALACGTVVVASDLPVLREVGGPAAVLAPVGDVAGWTATVLALLRERSDDPPRWQARRDAGRQWAARYSWDTFARHMSTLYEEVATAATDRRRIDLAAVHRVWRRHLAPATRRVA